MTEKLLKRIYSGFSCQEVRNDLKSLVDFSNTGKSPEEIEDMLNARLIPHLMNYGSPGFQSMFNTFPEDGALLGAEIALKYNQGVTNWQVSPGGAVLEELCCSALCRLFGLGDDSDATFMYSGTYANQEAVYLALHSFAEEKGIDFSREGMSGFKHPEKLLLLTSVDAHFSIKHAARILGLGDKSIISIPVDKNRRMNTTELNRLVQEHKETHDIFCVIATAGTTSTGAVDPVREIAEICDSSGLWLHVDGAYGLAYYLVDEWKHLFTGLERADSITWDPHKQLGIPIPNSVLFVRNWKDFNRMAIHSGYFNRRDASEPNPGIKSPPTTRPFSALPLVTSILHQGLDTLKERLQAPLVAVKRAAENLNDSPDIDLQHIPDTGIFCFRVCPTGLPESILDDLQKFVYSTIVSEGERAISLTELDGKTCLRLLAVDPVVTAEELLKTVELVRKTAETFNP